MNPADALLPLAQAAKEIDFDFWGTLLVWATIIVGIGLVVEYVPDFSERIEHSRWKRWFVIPGAVAVTFGVASEGFIEYKVLRTEGTLRTIVHEEDAVRGFALAEANESAAKAGRDASNANAVAEKAEADLAEANARAAEANAKAESFRLAIAAATERASSAEREASQLNLKAERLRSANRKMAVLMSGREVVDTPQLQALRQFAGVHLWVQTVPFDEATPTSIKASIEAKEFATKLELVLSAFQWEVAEIAEPVVAGPGVERIVVYSRRIVSKPGEAFPIGKDPSKIPPDTAQKRSWRAADALVAYFESIGLVDVPHWPLDTSTGAIRRPDFEITSGVPDAVVIVVGTNNAEDEIKSLLHEQDEDELMQRIPSQLRPR